MVYLVIANHLQQLPASVLLKLLKNLRPKAANANRRRLLPSYSAAGWLWHLRLQQIL